MRVLPDLLTRNWTLKVAALGLAMVLWATRRVETPSRQPLPGVPVRVQLSDPGFIMSDEPDPASVELRVGGPARTLFQMALDPPAIVVPVDRVTSMDTTLILRREWVRLQNRPGVVIEEIQPATVKLTFEPVETTAVPLVASTAGELDEGLVLIGEVSANPQVVRLTGPRSHLEGVDSARLVPVRLGDIDEAGTHRLQQPVDTANLGSIVPAPASASVILRVEEVFDREMASLPVRLDGVEEGALEVEPSTLTVTLRGPRSVVEALSASDVSVVVPASALEGVTEERTVPVAVTGLPDVVQASLDADSVVVRPTGTP